jgi:hypothetical protein
MRAATIFTVILMTTLSTHASPWNNPIDPVAIATESVAAGQRPILRVVHEEGPGGWQFYDGGPLQGKPVVLPKAEVLKRDASLAAVTDLPVGWEATRSSPSGKWLRRKVK